MSNCIFNSKAKMNVVIFFTTYTFVFLHFIIPILESSQYLSQLAVTGKRLTGHGIRTLQKHGPKTCVMECKARKSCKSINFNRNQMLCEITRSTAIINPSDFVADSAFIYLDMKTLANNSGNICQTANPCAVGTMCIMSSNSGHICIGDVGWDNNCLLTPNCYLKFNFSYDNSFTACYGEKYLRKTTYNPGKYVGVILCTATRYKLVLGDDPFGTFYNIGDGSNSGDDHCELIGGSDTMAVESNDYDYCPDITGFFRNDMGEEFSFGEIGYDSYNWFGTWLECGVSVPGSIPVLLPVSP